MSLMELYPAIDLRGGRCVRLRQGDYGAETTYNTDPVTVARRFAEAGARWLHVVDLDAARTGRSGNRDHINAIVQEAHPAVSVQVGGGLRDWAAVEALMSTGVDRAVVSTAALEDPAWVRDLAAEHPVALGLDVRGAQVAVRGWTQGSGTSWAEVLPRFEDAGVKAVIVTQITRDGTLDGPDLEGLAGVLEATELDVIASGGVGRLDDLAALAALSVGGRRLSGAIVGTALYEGRFRLGDALATVARRCQ